MPYTMQDATKIKEKYTNIKTDAQAKAWINIYNNAFKHYSDKFNKDKAEKLAFKIANSKFKKGVDKKPSLKKKKVVKDSVIFNLKDIIERDDNKIEIIGQEITEKEKMQESLYKYNKSNNLIKNKLLNQFDILND